MTNDLNLNLIKMAVAGDVEAINIISKLYEPYMNTLAAKKLIDEQGNEYMGIDVDLKDRLKTRLITAILKIKILS